MDEEGDAANRRHGPAPLTSPQEPVYVAATNQGAIKQPYIVEGFTAEQGRSKAVGTKKRFQERLILIAATGKPARARGQKGSIFRRRVGMLDTVAFTAADITVVAMMLSEDQGGDGKRRPSRLIKYTVRLMAAGMTVMVSAGTGTG